MEGKINKLTLFAVMATELETKLLLFLLYIIDLLAPCLRDCSDPLFIKILLVHSQRLVLARPDLCNFVNISTDILPFI